MKKKRTQKTAFCFKVPGKTWITPLSMATLERIGPSRFQVTTLFGTRRTRLFDRVISHYQSRDDLEFRIILAFGDELRFSGFFYKRPSCNVIPDNMLMGVSMFVEKRNECVTIIPGPDSLLKKLA